MIRVTAYELTQEQQILRETIREFAQKEIAPVASKIDWECVIPKDLLTKLPELGLFGISVPAESGGVGADYLSLAIAIEEVSAASGSLGALLSFHNWVVCEAISTSKMSQRQTLLRKLASGSIGAFDFSTLYGEGKSKEITCRIDDSKLIVQGNLEYVMNAAFAEVFLILGNVVGGPTKNSSSKERQTQRALFVFSKEQVSSQSFNVGAAKKLLGMRALGIAPVSFHSVELPLDSLVYEITPKEDELEVLLSKARLAISSQSLGIGQASIDASTKYANERIQFDTKIGNFYAVQDMIASDCVDLEAARAITYRTANEIKKSPSLARDSAVSKIASSAAAIRASRHAIRVHGGYGFTRDYPVERYARDARLTQVLVESNEDLKVSIARSLLGQSP